MKQRRSVGVGWFGVWMFQLDTLVMTMATLGAGVCSLVAMVFEPFNLAYPLNIWVPKSVANKHMLDQATQKG